MKKYFYFSRGQKIGIVIFLVIIFILLVINKSMPYLLKENTADKHLIVEVNHFKNTLKDKPKYKPQFKKKDTYITKKLVVFNPNTIDSIGFVSLGIKPKITHNILKYRQKGGTFRKASDFSKIYGISEKQFSELLPYISIPIIEKSQQTTSSKFWPKKENKEVCMVELNTCDTTQLKELKGIGSSFAKRIIKYRDILGGYANKEQLKEVYGLNSEKYDGIEKFVLIDTSFIKKIPVNKAGIERLKSHKYMNFYTAKAIYEQRKKLGKLTSKNDLKDLKDLPEETLQKILPYLSFE